MGRVVHTKGSIGGRGVAQGAICRLCPGGCKTDCQRAGVNPELNHAGKYDFSINFSGIEDTTVNDSFNEWLDDWD